MLAAHDRGDDARALLDAARRDPRFADDSEYLSYAARLEKLILTGEAPEPRPEASPPPVRDPARDSGDLDPIRQEFYEGFFAELAEESVGAQWRYIGRKLRSTLRMMRDGDGEGPTETACWVPVFCGPDADERLDRAYEAAGPPVDRRVGLQVELGGRGSGPDDGVEVRFGHDVVGVLRLEDLPHWRVGARLDGVRRAKLKRKRERPRFLLEVDIG